MLSSADSIIGMKTITVRIPDEHYNAVKQHAEADHMSMNAWIESVLDQEDMRRRCATHDDWLRNNPDALAFTEQWAGQYADELGQR